MGVLPVIQFGFPGPLRDTLVAAIIGGAKTSTTGLWIEYELAGDPLPVAGSRVQRIDSTLDPFAVLEITGVRLMRLDEVDLQHIHDEGEGHTTYAAWRTDHETFWHCDEIRAELNDPSFTVQDSTLLVLQRFRVVT
jgi:uncharacterized protein YhfF